MTVKRWSKEDEIFLMNSYSKLDNGKLAEHFGVSKIAIQRKLARLKLLRQYQKKWTESEEKFLHENFMKMNDRELAKVSAVTEIAIKRKLARLGCRRNLRQKRQKTNLDASAPPVTAAPPPSKKEVPAISANRKKTVRRMAGPALNPGETSRQLRADGAAAAEAPAITTKPECRKKTKATKNENAVPCTAGDYYNRSKSYEIGSTIYHKTWNDSGKVIKIIKTSGGNKAIVVEFSRCGQKTLLSEVSANELI